MEELTPKPVFLQLALPLSIIVAALLIAGALFYNRADVRKSTANIGGQPDQSAAVKISLNDSDHVLGDPGAKVTVVEYSDFQCPFCRSFWQDTFSQIKKDYIDAGKAKFVYRHFPLGFHPMAIPSAKAVECAAERGKFWELHDQIFEEQAKQGGGTIQYTEADIKNWAGQIGLSGDDFNQCLSSDKYGARIQRDLQSGNQFGVDGTPTIFVNGQRVIGAQSYAVFKAAIDAALK